MSRLDWINDAIARLVDPAGREFAFADAVSVGNKACMSIVLATFHRPKLSLRGAL